ncbi:hypothetical protein AJ80_07079 [Polytolypa hystricis UAMH7299]|uniref:WD40 repeat protein n=1 Tax=Polytolypa hystricis (strain UAMH7299) TaxID=1447883 RepID=A0A2B7XRX2_POLH7|nr:hypothetical protein AJ80_07079 [Polytolypa hystricis UAMH7299]
MASTASSTRFLRLASVARLLSLRSDIEEIILELLGHFSLEKIYSEGDKETYQQLVISLLTQLNAIYYIQRLTLPSENLQTGPYLGFLASWEVTLRSVEFVLQVIVEGRDWLWDARRLRDQHLSEFLISATRVLTLHPKAPSGQRARDRRDRFTRIHKSLERVYDSYAGPKSFLLLVCREITDVLRTDPDALAPPRLMGSEMPNLALELYPLPECLSSEYVSKLVPPDSSPDDWLRQFLALRDVSQFVVGAVVQYAINRETRDVQLQPSSVKTRNAVLECLERMRMPQHLAKVDLVATFGDVFRIVLPDTPNLARRNSVDSVIDECEMDAIDSLCAKLNNRRVIHRVSDRELMHNVSEITRNIALLDDPSGHFRSTRPRLYVINCRNCHLVGSSQLRYWENIHVPVRDSGEVTELTLPLRSKCLHCGDVVTMAREVSLARHAWDLLSPLESNADTINVERHLPTQFQLTPSRADAAMPFQSSYTQVPFSPMSQRSHDTEPFSPAFSRPIFPPSNPSERSSSIAQAPLSPYSSYRPKFDESITSIDEAVNAEVEVEPAKTIEPPRSPRDVSIQPPSQSQLEKSNSTESSENALSFRTRLPAAPPPSEKPKSRWMRFGSSKKETFSVSGDTSSLSSSALEAQRLEEIPLKTLMNMPKVTSKNKGGKNINVHLSQNSTYALFWTQASIHMWDVGSSPPTMKRVIATQSTCLLAAATKRYLAYVIGHRDQKLTLRIMNLVEPSTPTVEYRMASSLWCKSITICPMENYVVVGFENALVRFFKTTNSDQPREDRLHLRYHKECRNCPSVESLSFSNDGLVLLASIRHAKNGTIQIFAWRFPFVTFQELSSCRYHVPLHESEDNGITGAIFRSGPGGNDNLICITTWTQSGIPLLVQPEGGHRTEIKADHSGRTNKLGSRIQCAAFSPSGRELALVNDKGHLYQVSSLNSTLMDVRRIATSKELTSRSDCFAMSYMHLSDEDAIVLAWVDPSKSVGFVKKIPVTSGIEITSPTATVQSVPKFELSGDARSVRDLRDVRDITSQKAPVELAVPEDQGFFGRLKVAK